MPLGLLETVGFAREANTGALQWPSAAAATVTTLAPLVSETVTSRFTSRVLATVDGAGYPTVGEVDQQAISGQVTLRLRYGGLEDLWCAMLGLEPLAIGSTAMPATVATGAYRHLFEVDDSLEAEAWAIGDGWLLGGLTIGAYKLRRGTLALSKGVSVWECKSAMVSGWELSVTPQGVTVALDVVAHSLTRSGINTLNTMQAACANFHPNVMFHQGTLRMDTYSASTALSGADELKVTSFTLRCTHNLATGLYGPRLGNLIEEPTRQAAPELTGSLAIARHSVDTFLSRYEAGTLQMLDLKWIGPNIPGTSTPYQCNVYLPSVLLQQVDVPQSQSALSMPISFQALKPAAAAAGFPAVSRLGPLQVEVVSNRATNSLA